MAAVTEHFKWHLNVGFAERLLSVFGGTWMIVNAFAGGKPSMARAATGGYLLFRGTTGYCPVLEKLGKTDVNYRPSNINIKTALTINRPRHAVYAFWRTLSNLPTFMTHLHSVHEIDEKYSEWSANLPGGLGTIKWKSEIVKEEPGEFLSWHSVSEQGIENGGKIEFRDAGKFGTEIYFVISYHAPLGIVGEKAARLLNPYLETVVRRDLKNFKRYLETGEVPTTEGQPTGRKRLRRADKHSVKQETYESTLLERHQGPAGRDRK